MISNYHIIIPFNARWQDGCDYALQTIRLLAKNNRVIAVPMAHEESAWHFLSRLVHKQSPLTQWQGAAVFTPVTIVPLRRFSWLKKINYQLNIGLLRLLLARYQFAQKPLITIKPHTKTKKIIWFFEPYYSQEWLSLFGDWQVLYDCVDYWFGFPKQVAHQHDQLIKKAKWMAVNSQALFAAVKPLRSDVKQVPLGFAATDFINHSLHSKTKNSHQLISRKPQQKIFGFVGQFGNRLNFNWLRDLVTAFPQHKFVFIGAVWVWEELGSVGFDANLESLRQFPNCEFLPPVPKTEIPSFISQFDFGLIPYNTDQLFNKNCHPMKLYEYWFYGKPVVATEIVELSRYSDVLIATNTSAKAINWIAGVLKNGFDASKQQRVKQLATDNSWEAKLEAVSSLITPHHSQQ